MNKQHYSYLLMLNLGMLFVSTSGALGRYIALPPPLVIWCRALIAFVVLGIYCYWKKTAPFQGLSALLIYELFLENSYCSVADILPAASQ